jgi:Asp-tRNA(Asn)/Glu-tRNA(Gln) amidotransferase A subunit family amidase
LFRVPKSCERRRDLFASATTTRDAIVRGEISAEQACQRAIASRRQRPLTRFISWRPSAVERARSIARSRPLHGVPIALKDNIAVRGLVAPPDQRCSNTTSRRLTPR